MDTDNNVLNESASGAVVPEGEVAAEVKTGGQQAEQVPEGEVNPFDFSSVAEDAAEGSSVDEQADAQAVEGGGEYVLELGESFGGSDEVRGMITRHAQGCGIPAAAAGRFVTAVCDELLAGERGRVLREAKAAYEALEGEWGAEFSANMEGTKRFLHGLLQEGAIRQEDVGRLMCPEVFRLVNALRGRLGEGGTVGMQAAAVASRRVEYERIMNDPNCEEFRVLMNPGDPRYKATAARMNELAGMRLY